MRLLAPLLQNRWAKRPAKALFQRLQRPPRATDGVVTAFRDGEVTLRANRRSDGFTNAIQETGYQGVRRGDLVIHSMDGFAGAIGVSDSDGKASPVVHCYRPRPGTDARFYAYLLRTFAASGYITSLAKGIRERSTAFDAETFRSLVLPSPPSDEQRAIANFLDTETARIDALITKKRRMVDLLDDRHQASIDHAMHGLNALVSVRHLVSRLTSGPRGWSDLAGNEGTPFLRITNVQRSSVSLDHTDLLRVRDPGTAEAVRTKVLTGDVLVSITADIGSVGVATEDDVGGFVSQHLALLTPHACEGEWLAYAIKATGAQQQLDSGQYGGTKTQLSLSDIASLKVPCPPAHVRDERLAQLRTRLDLLESAKVALRRQIDLLQERRQALITAAVTGELDIPAAAA